MTRPSRAASRRSARIVWRRRCVAGSNNRGALAANSSGQAFGRRWPWLSREDYDLLKLFDDRDQAAAFLKTIRAQSKGDRQFREAVVSECDLPVGKTAETLLGQQVHRWGYGAGGGRRTPRAVAAE